MLGNKAVARGLRRGRMPRDTPATRVNPQYGDHFEEAAKYPEIYCEWAPNEKVALGGGPPGGLR